MTDVITLLRGDPAMTDRFLEAFKAANLRADNRLTLIAGVNNDADAAKIQAVSGTVIRVNKYDGRGDERDRIEFIADLWNIVISKGTNETLILWDDDVIPGQLGVSRILSTLAANNQEEAKVAGVVSVYPFRDRPDFAVLYTPPYRAMPMTSVPRENFEAYCGGMGLSAWFKAKLKPTLPWHVRELPGGSPAGTDLDVTVKLKEAGLKILCDGRVRSEHVG